MNGMSRIKRLVGVALLAAAVFPLATAANAVEVRQITNKNGDVVFEAHFYDDNDALPFDSLDTQFSKFELGNDAKDAVVRALQYWVERLSNDSVPVEPVVVNIGGINDRNAYAGPNNIETIDINGVEFYIGGMEKTLVLRQPIDPADGASHARVGIGDGFTYIYDPVGQIQSKPDVSLESVVIHEIGHALGMLAYGPPDAIGEWTNQCEIIDGAGFAVGQHAAAVYGDTVWGGANRPKPVPMNFENGEVDLGHFDLRNALFTHKTFRNHGHFIEVEMAALQDLGYDIDRRNFYGKSVYQDNQVLVNYDGFFDRANGMYLPGTYNRSSLGMGLHLYGNNIDITQRNDLLSIGRGGVGIRSDGIRNTIVIDKGVKVHANGQSGTGLLVAYGHGTKVAHRGDLQAMGADGIAARFDIGCNMMGNGILSSMVTDYFNIYNDETTLDSEQYSYYQRQIPTTTDGGEALSPSIQIGLSRFYDDDDYSEAERALDGALVDAFDITGSIRGAVAAVYISPNSHVKEINVMNGADVSGAFITDYHITNGAAALPTLLTFGKMADSRGFATRTGDNAFSHTINYPIIGDGSGLAAFSGMGVFDLEFVAGRTTMGSTAEIAARNASVTGGTLALAAANMNNRFELTGDIDVQPAGTLSFADPAGGVAEIKQQGTATIAGIVEVGPANTMQFAGETVFLPGSALSLTVSAAATVGLVESLQNLSIAGPTELLLFGNAADGITDQLLMRSGTDLTGFDNLYSNFFALTRTGPGSASASLLSYQAIQANLFGANQSVNMAGGARFADYLRGGNASAGLTRSLSDYYLRLQSRTLPVEMKGVALRQLYGEYAPVIRETLRADADRLRRRVDFRLNRINRERLISSSAERRTAGSGGAHASLGAAAAPAANRVWGGGFGNWTRQDARDNMYGYDYDAVGAVLGYDRYFGNLFSAGLAAAYTDGKTKIDPLLTSGDTEAATFGLYGEYRHESGVFLKAGAGYGHGWNDYDTAMVVGGSKSGSFDTNLFYADLSAGYAFGLPHGMTLRPSAGLEYGHFRSDSWRETAEGDGIIAGRFAATRENTLDIPVSIAFGKLWETGRDGFVHLEGRAAWVRATRDNRAKINTGFAGTAARLPVYGIDTGKNAWRLGAALECRLNERFDLGVEYECELRRKYQNHALSISVGIGF